MPRTTRSRSTEAAATCGSSLPTSVILSPTLHHRPKQSCRGLTQQDSVGVVGREIPARGHLIDGLGLGLNAVPEEGDERITHAPVQRRAEDRAGRLDVRVRADGSNHPGRVRNRGLGIKRKRALRREPDLVAAKQQHLAERLVHAAAQHDHVEQHCRGDRDPCQRQGGAERTTAQTPYPPTQPGHARPQSTIGRVFTRRHAASAPAASPSTSESAMLKSRIRGVMSENTRSVSKKRW